MKREDVCFLMVQARHLIEASGTPERYSVVNFYADWTVHTALDRSSVCLEALRDITRVVAENMAPTSPDLTSQISRIIGFPKLRRELIALFRENTLSVVLFEFYENWKSFVMFLLWHLVGQPIGFPDQPKGAARRIRDEMLALPRPYSIAVEALAIVDQEGAYHWCLRVVGDKTLTIMGLIDIGETRADFPPSPVS